jgi:hypothetical protein
MRIAEVGAQRKHPLGTDGVDAAAPCPRLRRPTLGGAELDLGNIAGPSRIDLVLTTHDLTVSEANAFWDLRIGGPGKTTVFAPMRTPGGQTYRGTSAEDAQVPFARD